MSIFSLRMNEHEEKLIKDYARLNKMTVSELFRSSVLEKIESEIDLKLYSDAMEEHRSSPNDVSFDEMMKQLNSDK